MTSLILGAMLAGSMALAAPPSSPMSNPELSPPRTTSKSQQVTTLYKCTGYYNSYDCTTTLWMKDCSHSIQVFWGPLSLPGTHDWARLHRNWCSVVYDGAEYREERKLEPEKCDGLMRLLASAFEGFPETKWQDAKCTYSSTPDGFLYESQRYHPPGHPDLFHNPLPDPDPEPRAILLEDVRSCELHTTAKKRRYVRCPVLVAEVNAWMKKYLAYLDVALVIQNTVKPSENAFERKPLPTGREWNAWWRGSLLLGLSFANTSTYTLGTGSPATGSSGFTFPSGDDLATKSAYFGGELTYQLHPVFGLAAIFEWSEYNYTGSNGADNEVALLVMPRVQKNFGDKHTLWAGLGLGLVDSIIGITNVTAGTQTATIDSNSVGLAFSPRFGLDFRLTSSFWLGAELFYMRTYSSLNAIIADSKNGSTSTLTESFTRSWWGVAAKFGFDL